MIAPAQLGGSPLPPVGGSALTIGAVVFGIVFLVVVGGAIFYYRDGGSDPWEAFADACYEIVEEENADAIAFIPYSDGPLIPKPAIYDRELMGGKGGYRTPDGEIIYVDGQGNGMFTLEGVDVILAIDPTEHCAAADPLKAWIAHKTNNVGEWIKVDREGTVVEAGDALRSMRDVTPAADQPVPEGRVAPDGGYPSEVHQHAAENGMAFEDALAELEAEGLVTKIADLAPPREAVIDDGEVRVEEADHVAVDVSQAAELLPKKTNTTALQTAIERARQEGRDDEKIQELITYGVILGAAITGILSAVFLLFFMFS